MPHHLQQPVGQGQQQEKSEQRTVERIHERSTILNAWRESVPCRAAIPRRREKLARKHDWSKTAPRALTASNNSATYNSPMHSANMHKSFRSPAASGLVLVTHLAAICAFLLLGCLAALAAKEFEMPTAQPARSYPAHDDHPLEKVVLAAD